MNMRPGAIAFLLIVGISGSLAQAKELKNEELGFLCVVPDKFAPFKENEPDDLFVLANEKPGRVVSPFFIQIKRMRVVAHEADYHLSVKDITPREGKVLSGEEFQWKGRTLTVVREEYLPPFKDHMVNYLVYFPLDEEAVELEVHGMADRDAEIKKLFYEVASGFENLRPLRAEHSVVKTVPVRTMIKHTSLYDMIKERFRTLPASSIVTALVLLMVLVFGGVLWLVRRRSS